MHLYNLNLSMMRKKHLNFKIKKLINMFFKQTLKTGILRIDNSEKDPAIVKVFKPSIIIQIQLFNKQL